MAKVYSCPQCGMVLRGETETEVLKKAAEHNQTAHGMKEVTEKARQMMREAVRDEE